MSGMNCFVCNADMVDSTTNHVVNLEGGQIIIVKNVPCQRCKQCNEVWYNGVVAARLDELVQSLSREPTEITVVNYPDRVA